MHLCLSFPSHHPFYFTPSRRNRRRNYRGGLPLRNAHQEILCTEGSGARRRAAVSSPAQWLPGPYVSRIFEKNARLAVIGQVRVKNFMVYPLPQHFIAQWHQHFYALVQIARHPVGSADVNLFVAAIGKVENAAVLQEAAHNAANADVVAHSPHSRTERANPTHDQTDLYSGLRGAI